MGGPLKYYVSKSVGQMLMLADKVGGWERPNADILRWVGGLKKGQKHADVILEWSLK